MKHLITILSLFTLHSSLFAVFAAVPLRWTVETSRAVPATFEAYQGETLELEAALQSYGKPLEAPANYALYWQTNGMGSAWWEAPVSSAPSPTNVLRATWLPAYDVGAKAYTCFIGAPGTIYHAAFQLRLRPSPGATPNELPLPAKTIDFATVTIEHADAAPWASTNAVQAAARPLPKYLHALDFDDSYPDAAAEYYRSRGDGKTDGGCSAVRDGGFLCRNFDFPFDDRAEFVVKMSAGPGRFASVGVAQAGTNLTEAIVTSGKPSRCYKWLPGATVDGINEHGVVCEINVVDTEPPRLSGGDIHPLGAVRWALDNGTSAEMVATSLAARIMWPSGWRQNFHWMVADEGATYIVENGNYSNVTGRAVMTNFRLNPWDDGGEGHERYDALMGGANITSQWWTLTYTVSGYRASDLPGITGEDLANLFNYWENNPRESHRGEDVGGQPWWQTVHTSIYDLTNRTLRVAVQETDDWYTFAVPVAGGVKPDSVREIVQPMLEPVSNIAVSAQQTASAAQTAATNAQQTADEATRLVGALADEKRDKTDLDYGGFWTAGDVVLLPNEDYECQPCFESVDGTKRLYWFDTWYYAYQVDPRRESYAYDSETGVNMVYDLRAAEFWVGPDGSRVRAVFSQKTRLATTNDVSAAVTQIGEVAARAVTQPEGSTEPDDYRVQIGHGATATGDASGRIQSIAIGLNATATNRTSIAIGPAAGTNWAA